MLRILLLSIICVSLIFAHDETIPAVKLVEGEKCSNDQTPCDSGCCIYGYVILIFFLIKVKFLKVS